MNTNIWNSTHMAGTGGALKALAKNLANQLKLNRTDMKRVVARVISERHGHGDVGDYNGHMFFVKPERIDMTKQITHSKEAFDEMLNKKNLASVGSKTQLRTPRTQSESRISTYHMPGKLKPAKSLTGVRINRHHLKRRGNANEIVVQMSQALLRSKSRLGFRRLLPTPATQSKRQPKLKLELKSKSNVKLSLQTKPSLRTKPKIKMLNKKKSTQKLSSPSKPKLLTKSKSVLKPLDKIVESKRKPRRQVLEPIIARLPAGHSIAKAVLSAIREDSPMTAKRQPAVVVRKTKSTLEQKKSRKLLVKSKHIKKKVEKKGNRLLAGGILGKTSRNLLINTQKTRHWCNPYQFPGGAGATYQPNPRPSAVILRRSKSLLKNKQLKQVKQTHVIRRTRSKRSQLMLTKRLKEEEPIDEPERMLAGTVCQVVPGKRAKPRRYKLSSRIIELAKPAVHRCAYPELLPKPSLKLKARHRSRSRSRRVLQDSSQGSLMFPRATSGSDLTPAKRHLTLAFMKKEGQRTPCTPRSPRSVLWK